MTACVKCKSIRVGTISSKSSDMNFVRVGDRKQNGYVPFDLGIGGGDYIKFEWCLDCGQIAGEFPVPDSAFERGEEE